MVGIGQIGKGRARVSAKGMLGQFVKMRMLSGAVSAVQGSLEVKQQQKCFSLVEEPMGQEQL